MDNPAERAAGIDRFRLVAALLVVAVHVGPLGSANPTLDMAVSRVLARVAVPFFLMVTGYFVLGQPGGAPWHRLRRFSLRVCKWYAAAVLLYLPVNLYAGQVSSLPQALQRLLVDGTFYHLWYFPALLLGVWLTASLLALLPGKAVLGVCAGLYAAGLLGDSYYGLAAALPAAARFYGAVFAVSAYTRNGLFYVPLFLLLGVLLARRAPVRRTRAAACTAACLALLLAEGVALHALGWPRHDSMYLMLPLCMWFLFQALLTGKGRAPAGTADFTALVYVLHPLCLVAVRGLAKAAGVQAALVGNSVVLYLAVCGLAAGVSLSLLRLRPLRPSAAGRAWVEVDLGRVCRNARALQGLLPDGCALMPAVKADGYGHGAAQVARALNRAGVRAFCVACVQEGVALRRARVRGTVLILGYTSPADFPLLARYRLTQTVLDLDYAGQLCAYGRALDVHLKIDTGMNRLGERSEGRLLQICRCKNLRITGAYTHLCASDSLLPDDVDSTWLQVKRFYQMVQALRGHGCAIPKVHLQASYGILNYPGLRCDYARPGIALYGVHSAPGDATRCNPALQPALSLRARVAAVKAVRAGETVGYGRAFTAGRDMVLAVLAIGYADGLPRSLSCGKGWVLLHGVRAPIVGRVCMDQAMVDATGCGAVSPGDCATLIGVSGGDEIGAAELAGWAGTISNELLSRLGGRLPRVYTRRGGPRWRTAEPATRKRDDKI
ncbi:serine racemase VanT catalytic subunit [Intestinibacillus massiliensis]|nr:serine racemase VanT catalytic subunit [Intestinibacillus massiliensis]